MANGLKQSWSVSEPRKNGLTIVSQVTTTPEHLLGETSAISIEPMQELWIKRVVFSCVEGSLEGGFVAEIAQTMLGSQYLPEFNSVSKLEVVML